MCWCATLTFVRMAFPECGIRHDGLDPNGKERIFVQHQSGDPHERYGYETPDM